MKELDLKTLLLAVEGIARQAGAEIMKHYAGTAIYTKDDGSQVTDADHAAENLILPALAQLTPHIPIVSEERVAAGEIPDVSGGTFWTVDPLDGTHEFINKTGNFMVAIALIVESKPVLGILYYPTTGIMYSGGSPGTASKTDENGVRTFLAAGKTTMRETPQALVKPNADMAHIEVYLSKQFNKAVRIDEKPASVLATEILTEAADMAVVCPVRRNGRTKWWDVAPGHAIIESAGGRVETLDGQPLRYDAADLQVPPHILISPLHARTAAPPPEPPRLP